MVGDAFTEASDVAARAAAFRGLADRHLDASYRLAYAILGNPAEAQDATHDAFVQAWRRWASLRDPDRFEQWFSRILAPAELRASVAGLPDTMPTPVTVFGGRRNVALLAAAAMLTALLVGGALAVGSGLIRLPWMDDDRADGTFALAGPIGRCDQTLADGVLLWAWDPGPPGSAAPELTAYENGLVVTGPSAELGGSGNTLDATWSQRRLTADGIRSLLDAVTNSLPSCQSFEFETWMHIRARSAAGVFSISLGVSPFETRTTTPAQAAAIRDLVERLDEPDLGLPASSWEDAEWHPYVPERWRFLVRFSDPVDVDYPTSDGLVLPDGSVLLNFGSEEALDPGWLGLTMVRCGVADAEETRAIAEILTEAGGVPVGYPPEMRDWYFTSGEEVRNVGGLPYYNVVTVSVVGLLPHEPDCPSDAAAAGAPSPAPGPSAAGDEPAPFVDACDYIPAALVGEVIGPLNGDIEHHTEWNIDWSMCWHPVSGDAVAVFASRRSIPGDRAAAQARSLFGDVGFTAEEIAGHGVFLNGCDRAGQCRAAVAISIEPHFVVITWQAGSQASLRQLAERLIPMLETGD